MAPAATVRVLVRNLESDAPRLQFSKFFIEGISNWRQCTSAKEFFPEAVQGEWILIREYDAIPPADQAPSGYGAIPNDVEELLLLLRLYRPGDLAFAALTITTPNSSGRQCSYRAISNLVGNHSTRPYKLNQGESAAWEEFEAQLRTSPQWKSGWFGVCRRCLLYGGGKEFNPNFESEVDRAIDYASALEAALVPEGDFVSRRLRERAVRLLALEGDAKQSTKKLLNALYGIRSTLVHGSPLKREQMDVLRDRKQWWRLEELVREVMVRALQTVPSDEPARRACLSNLYELSDQERAAKLRQDFKAIKAFGVKQDLLKALSRNSAS